MPKKYSDANIISELQRVAVITSKSPSQADFREHGEMCVKTVINRFGGWNDAKVKAGLEERGCYWRGERDVETKQGWYKKVKENSSCFFCDEAFHAVLQFHHIDPDKKKHNVGNLVKKTNTLEELKEEASKCILLCSNCHNKLHADDHKLELPKDLSAKETNVGV